MTLKLRMTMRLGIILVMNSKNHQAFWVNVPNLIILVPLVIVLKVPTTMHLVIQLWVHMLVVLMDMTKIMVGLEIGIEIELREHKKEERRVMKQIEIQLNSHLFWWLVQKRVSAVTLLRNMINYVTNILRLSRIHIDPTFLGLWLELRKTKLWQTIQSVMLIWKCIENKISQDEIEYCHGSGKKA